MDRKTAERLRREYPNHVPIDVAAPFLGVSPRRLTQLGGEGRRSFAPLGANLNARQRYVRIYTEPLISLLCSRDYDEEE